MFRNRVSSRKPGEDFIANFRQTFPEVGNVRSIVGSTDAGNSSLNAPAVADHPERHGALDQTVPKDLDLTPGAQHVPFRFTPSLLDVNSFAFSAFANQPPGYYTPTPGGVNMLYHPQAGDLHTPGMSLGMGLGTPLSLPTSAAGLQASVMLDDISSFSHRLDHGLPSYDPFEQRQAPQAHHHDDHDGDQHEQRQQTSFAPSSFVHRDTGYETMEPDGSPLGNQSTKARSTDTTLQQQSPVMAFQPSQYNMAMTTPASQKSEKFRFHVVLAAATAMIKHVDEIPVTYLNKGQTYSITIDDQEPPAPRAPGTRFRTFVRISFEDEQQRQRPSTCWQLWKEGRGTNESHQRGGKLQAVEYVESIRAAEGEQEKTRVELDTASFDGFSVIWTPSVTGRAECTIAVRFNFLSTDFSHSKGVKGIPVRLCAKTEMTSPNSPRTAVQCPEVVFCKVKLFRDHGAERKLSNDVAHVQKSMAKLKQQIVRAESGLKDLGKRKRTAAVIKVQANEGPGKFPKPKRTWSMSSSSSGRAGKPAEDDLHFKLHTMLDMFTSTRPASVFFLRGAEGDDPDLHPVTLPGEPADLTKVDSKDSSLWLHRKSIQSSSGFVSPSPSSISIQSQLFRAASATVPTAPWSEYPSIATASTLQGSPTLGGTAGHMTRVSKLGQEDCLDAIDVDPSYSPPPERTDKPVVCFYILLRDRQPSTSQYHRAIYLMQRTLRDLTTGIASKWDLDPTRVVRALHVLERGLEVEMDDDVIRELTDGQDMTLEVSEVALPDHSLKHEWDEPMDTMVDGENAGATQKACHRSGYEFRLTF